MKLRRRVLALIVIMFAVVIPVSASTSIIRPLADYKPGPTFQLPNGHRFAVRYDSAIRYLDIGMANRILNSYLPRLFDLFWSPSDDLTITVHKTAAKCGPDAVACEAFTEVYIGSEFWSNEYVWVHEFTHVLQYTLTDSPGHAVGDEAMLFYIEPTANAAGSILVPFRWNYWRDLSFLTSDYSMTEAAYNYNNFLAGERHAQTSLWNSLHEADENAFREVNERLSELAKKRVVISNASALRSLISETVGVKVLDGLAIDQWLAVEGLLGENEVGNATMTHVVNAGYEADAEGGNPLTPNLVRVHLQANSIKRIVVLDTMRTTITIHDALTREQILRSTAFERVEGYPFMISYENMFPEKPFRQVLRIDLHIVGAGFTEDRHFLLPLYRREADRQSDVILFTTPDGWLQSVDGVAEAGGREYQISNGLLKLELTKPSDIRLSAGPARVIPNFVPSNKIMILGENYSALSVVKSTITFRGQTAETSSNTKVQEPIFGVAWVSVIIAAVVPITLAMLLRLARKKKLACN